MRIRNEQIEILKQVPMRVFEDEMTVHLAEFSPPLFNAIKEDQLRKVIRFGIDRARQYGITFRGPIRLYLELMLLLGSYFDNDPQYPWATEILVDESSASQIQRAENLYDKTCEYREKVGGSRDEYTLKALRGIAEFARKPLQISSSDLVSTLLDEMGNIYPQKKEFVGEHGLRMLIDKGMATAQEYGFSAVRSLALPVVLMFAFGHGCFNDPLYPWIAKTVQDKAVIDPEARARRLEKKSLTWLDHVLAYFDENT
jgi:hypothetical protein